MFGYIKRWPEEMVQLGTTGPTGEWNWQSRAGCLATGPERSSGMRDYLCTGVMLLVLSAVCLSSAVFAAANKEGNGSMKVVRYEDFGAKGDGKADDIEAIAKTHEFANERGLPVRADDNAVYYIGGKDLAVPIQTDTDFGSAKFIIDDRALDNIKSHIFQVRSSLKSIKPEGITSLKRDQPGINLKLPGPCVVQVKNDNVKHYIRKGLNPNSGSAQTDVFLVDGHGNVDASTPIQWDFDQITDIVAYPVDAKTLTIKGGRFTTIANAEKSEYNYHSRGILIKRSNVVVDGLEHHITGEGDHGAPYQGFISINDCANVTVRNTLLTGHKMYSTIGRAGKPVSMGSYDISPARVINVIFENCRQTNDINDRKFWGIMGSNFCRNLRYENCVLSRFDAHQGVYNASIRNSTIGHMGVLAIGKGTLLVENTTIQSGHFIGLRPDYGSTWQGDVVIRNCIFKPTNPAGGVIIDGSNSGDHDFGYICYMPERITIDKLRIEDSKAPKDYKGVAIFANFNPSFKTADYRQKFPYVITREVVLKDVTTASGKPLRISDNTFMFKDVAVKGL